MKIPVGKHWQKLAMPRRALRWEAPRLREQDDSRGAGVPRWLPWWKFSELLDESASHTVMAQFHHLAGNSVEVLREGAVSNGSK